MADYYTGTAHGQRLSAALDDFQQALTKRWRELVTYAIIEGSDDYPTQFKREATSNDAQMWPYWTAEANYHLGYDGAYCAYVDWVRNGQQGDLSAVKCDGKTGSSPDVPLYDEYDKEIPQNIDCGMGRNLELIGNWAAAERDAIFEALPLFDTHDLPAIEDTYDAFVELGSRLGLNQAFSGDYVFDPSSDGDLVNVVAGLSGENAQGQDWWAGWTGLAASRAKDGFFASVVPTMNNQASISGSLANLYSARAAIIEKGRNDGLYWTQWATKSLDETQTITTDLTVGWKAVQGIGGAVSIAGSWSVVGGAVGASVSLVGFLGENLMGSITSEGYRYDLVEAMRMFLDKIDLLNDEVADLERSFGTLVLALQSGIWGVHSFNLELYDLTENSADGDHESTDGYTADVDDILRLAEACYAAGEQYGQLVSVIEKTRDADKHLSGENGEPIRWDIAALEVRDQLKGFVETAQGRYLLAGDQIKASAEAYANVETDQKDAFDRVMEDWAAEGVGDYGDVDAKDLADDTDRGEHPGRPSEGTPAPAGAGDGEDYITDENS